LLLALNVNGQLLAFINTGEPDSKCSEKVPVETFLVFILVERSKVKITSGSPLKFGSKVMYVALIFRPDEVNTSEPKF
jgi:hypothetical protein